MAVSGLIGAGAQEAVTDLLQQQLVRQQLEQQAQEAQQAQALRAAQLAQDQQQFEATLAQRAAEQAEAADDRAAMRRMQVNLEGLRRMDQDREALERDEAERAIAGNPRLVQLSQLRRLGVTGVTPEDLDSPEERMARERAEDDRIVSRASRVASAQRGTAEPDYQRVVVNGKETFMTPEEVRAMGGTDAASRKRPSTGMERQTLGYYNRMKEAMDTMDAVEDGLTERDVMLINNSPLPDLVNNRLLSQAGQQYAQALRTYTEARLRKESGAAIAAHEYETDRQAIGRQGGDTSGTRKQKARTRQLTAEGIAYAAGPAYEEYYGEPFARSQEPGAAKGVTVRLRAPNGQIKDVPAAEAERYLAAGAKVVQP